MRRLKHSGAQVTHQIKRLPLILLLNQKKKEKSRLTNLIHGDKKKNTFYIWLNCFSCSYQSEVAAALQLFKKKKNDSNGIFHLIKMTHLSFSIYFHQYFGCVKLRQNFVST